MEKKCKAEGCLGVATKKGLCNKHYLRLRKRGNLELHYHNSGYDCCQVEGCSKPIHGKGYCSMHHTRLLKDGDVGCAESKYIKSCICLIEGCKKQSRGKGYCSMHYARLFKHGDVNHIGIVIGEDRNKNPLYGIYCGIRERCYSKSIKSYKDYGGRGITICDRRLGNIGFNNFCEDMGERPKGTSIDRINVNGNYEPNNCKWSTYKEQANNRRHTISYNGENTTEASKRLGLGPSGVRQRIRLGRTLEKAFNTLAIKSKHK